VIKEKFIMANHKHNDVFVVPRGDEWVVKKPHAERASAVLPTKAEAVARAKELAGRGEIHIQGKDGKFK
jgi:Uncharacterized protein conserved in bacteria (DUF2188)